MSFPARSGRFSSALFLCVFASGLLVAAPGHARKPPAIQTFKTGKPVNKAFNSLIGQYKPVKALFKRNLQKYRAGHYIKEGLVNLGIAPLTAGNAGLFGYGTFRFGQALAQSISSGSPAGIAGSAVMITMVGAATLGAGWMTQQSIRSAGEQFSLARQSKNSARKKTLLTLIKSTSLQKRINEGKPLPASDLTALKAMANSL